MERVSWSIDIEEEYSEPSRERCIYRVPQAIRRVNEEAYTPQLISIGPLHHGKSEFSSMEKEKIRYMESFRRRTTRHKMHEIYEYIKDKEQSFRSCYSESSDLDKFDYGETFLKMIAYDAIFIIELFIRNYHKEHYSDFLLDIPSTTHTLFLDLLLIENQLPYFVLQEICDRNFLQPTFMELLFHFFSVHSSLFDSLPDQGVKVDHFTDLARNALLKQYKSVTNGGSIVDLPSAFNLQSDSGVKFKRNNEGESLLDIRFKKVMRPWGLEVGELQIPNLKIYDETECLLRNMMAFEQCHHHSSNNLVCSYVDFIDCLINTEKDVDVLVEAGIITNCIDDNASVQRIFNGLCTHIFVSNSAYHGICEELKKHHKHGCNRAWASLIRVYFTNPWKSAATFAATLLLVLTFIQTVCSIIQVR